MDPATCFLFATKQTKGQYICGLSLKYPHQMIITIIREFFAFFLQRYIWILFIILILNEVPYFEKYDSIKFSFSCHFCIFTNKQLVFKYLLSRLLTNLQLYYWLHCNLTWLYYNKNWYTEYLINKKNPSN